VPFLRLRIARFTYFEAFLEYLRAIQFSLDDRRSRRLVTLMARMETWFRDGMQAP
jgi:hypothetical protein